MQNTRSFFTAQDSKVAQEIMRSVTNSSIKGRRIRVAPEMN
jgi:hypothetical protein